MNDVMQYEAILQASRDRTARLTREAESDRLAREALRRRPRASRVPSGAWSVLLRSRRRAAQLRA